MLQIWTAMDEASSNSTRKQSNSCEFLLAKASAILGDEGSLKTAQVSLENFAEKMKWKVERILDFGF